MASTSALPPRSASVSSAPGGVASVAGPDTGAPSSGGGGNVLLSNPQQYCLRWNNHQHNLLSVFEDLLHNEAFVDVTLACDGQQVRQSVSHPSTRTLKIGCSLI